MPIWYNIHMRYIIVRIILTILFAASLLFLVLIARGYRFSFTDNKINSTGILVATSSPTGAKVYVNGALKGATNQNISLPPGNYTVEITKEGYTSWRSELGVKGEVVTNASATLFPLNPSLSPITNLGIVYAQFFPDAEKVIIVADNPQTASESADASEPTIEKNGIYALDNANGPLRLLNGMRLLIGKSKFDAQTDLSDVVISMSPDGSEMLLTTNNSKPKVAKTYLVSTEKTDQSLFETTKSKQVIEQAWEKKRAERVEKILETFKKPLADIALSSFDIIGFSIDETKILYHPKSNTTIPIIIKPRLIGTNQTSEVRNVIPGNIYVYDKKEDKNYLLSNVTEQFPLSNRKTVKITNQLIENWKSKISSSLMWHPNSTQLVIKGSENVSIIDYDGTHEQTVYSGPIQNDFLAVTGDGKLLITANLNPQRNPLPDLYAVGIK